MVSSSALVASSKYSLQTPCSNCPLVEGSFKQSRTAPLKIEIKMRSQISIYYDKPILASLDAVKYSNRSCAAKSSCVELPDTYEIGLRRLIRGFHKFSVLRR